MITLNINRSLFLFIIFILPLIMNAQARRDTSTVYIHQDAPSFSARFLETMARLFLPKNRMLKMEGKEHSMPEAATIPRHLFSEFNIDITEVCGRKVYSIAPKGNSTGKYVLYLHGGAYIHSIYRQHWKFAAKIIRETNCTFILPDYALAPACTYADAFIMLEAIYKSLLAKADAKDIILMGDSAGGGLALALAEKQRNDGATQSAQIILLAPWLDVSMSNPDIKEVQKKDAILRAKSLVVAGKAWAGGSSTDNYLVSPVYGSLDGLPMVSIFIGTHDILIADCRKLKAIMEQKGIPVNYFEYPKMFHDWMMLTSLKESKKAISQICSLIKGEKP
jgi:acetyl esterase/lipase